MSDEPSDNRRTTRGARPTMQDIAWLAKVSAPTVSRVLSGSPLVTGEKRERVLEVARACGYAINRNARKLRQARSGTIAVMLDFASHRQGAIGAVISKSEDCCRRRLGRPLCRSTSALPC